MGKRAPPPWSADDAARAWVHHLAPDGGSVAFVVRRQGVWAARSVADLVDGVWHAHPDVAHTLLRGRVVTNRPASEVDRAVVQVCGRKLGAGVRGAPGAVPPLEVRWMDEAAAASRVLHVAASEVAVPAGDLRAWLRPAPDDAPLRHRDRPIRAVLLGADGAVLAAAANTNGRHRMRHAELNLLQRWAKPLPDGATVLVGLQCCRMCAAMLVDAAEGALAVRFVDPEPGPFGRHTALQRKGWEQAL